MADSSSVTAAARQLDEAAPETAHRDKQAIPEYGDVVNRHPKYHMQYDEHGHPRTLLDWRMAPLEIWQTGRKLWNPLDGFFDSRGYSLFVARPNHNCHYGPKDIDEIRTLDAYHHILDDGRKSKCSFYPGHLTNKLIPATRKSDGAHVMVQLVCKADQGSSELDILRYFSQAELQQCPENHVLPILDELEYQDMKFVVLPLLFEGLVQPWYHTVGEALEAVRQTFEAISFLHSHRVAHMDLFQNDFLLNYGGVNDEIIDDISNNGGTFRSHFPCRYYVIDLELAVQFSSAVPLDDCKVRGLPTASLLKLTDPKKYGKPMPPEWLGDVEYCPFKSDVYQLAMMWIKTMIMKLHELKPLNALLIDMTDKDASARPDMGTAVDRLCTFLASLTESQMSRCAKDLEKPWESPF